MGSLAPCAPVTPNRSTQITKELPDYADLEADLALAFPDYALDLEAELAFGPAKCAAQEGIRRMELRIKGLTREAARASKRQIDFRADCFVLNPPINSGLQAWP